MKTAAILIAAVLALSLTGCASAIPGSEDVRITKNANDIKGCKVIAQVYATKKMIRNVALINDGDTALLLSGWLTGTMDGGGQAVLYNCRGTNNRQPVPVIQVK
jgi:outer membrane lipoprotein SlyB